MFVKDGQKFFSADLRKYYNHKLFYADETSDAEAGLNGLYLPVYSNKICRENKTERGVPYVLTLSGLDNFYCDRQKIEINQTASKIHFIGFSYFGEAVSKISIFLADEENRSYDLRMRDCTCEIGKDWWFDFYEPLPESIVQAARYRTAGKAEHTFCFFDRVCDVGKNKFIEKICFDDNTFLHIVAITLETISK